MVAMLIRRRSSRAAAEAQWRAEVTAQLSLLMKAQTQMAEVASLQLKDREHRRPSWLGWVQAACLLAISGSFVLSGIILGNTGTIEASTASTLQTQANSAIAHVNKAAEPIVSLTHRKGAAWVIAHPTKAEVNELTSAARWAKQFHEDSTLASAEQRSADRDQLTGPALLSFGSALFGAVLGWMLTPFLTSLRWPRKSETKAP